LIQVVNLEKNPHIFHSLDLLAIFLDNLFEHRLKITQLNPSPNSVELSYIAAHVQALLKGDVMIPHWSSIKDQTQ